MNKEIKSYITQFYTESNFPNQQKSILWNLENHQFDLDILTVI